MAVVYNRPGQANAAGDELALFLKKFSGEVLTAFLRKVVMNKGRVLTRSLRGAKQAQFPATWRTTAQYFVPGVSDPLEGANGVKHGERVIALDYPLLTDIFIAEWDEIVNHYDIRGIYSTMQGEALAVSHDETVMRVFGLAARASDLFGGDGFTGEEIVNANAASNGETLAALIFDAAQALDEKDIPEDTRTAYMKPAPYYLLAQTTKVINKDWGGAGVYADGKVLRVAGIELVKTNRVPSADLASNPTGVNPPNDYTGDFTNTVVVGGHPSAAGVVKAMDVSTQMKWRIEHQAHQLVSKLMVGSGILRPEAAFEIKTA